MYVGQEVDVTKQRRRVLAGTLDNSRVIPFGNCVSYYTN